MESIPSTARDRLSLKTEDFLNQKSRRSRGKPMIRSSVLDSPILQTAATELPLTVKEAAKFLGVSPQTVYLWVERKQIPHLRVMGRNIRFLKSDLEPFRASFKQEMENE